ncbi:trimeric LpxA-like protein [Podospora fimiseda]|uniref:Trimeric LpxA-like protein n=1 Tax=Podospora fimiseda TaxID=252190 RepID=A0AAN7BJ00_9PEZI|nr:trimeric LpxA-like protein [Podospora fimiseda]
MRVSFPAGNQDFRNVRNEASRACREFNSTPEDATPLERSRKWLDIVNPNRDRSKDSVVAITHDQTFANTNLVAKTPFIKPPIQIDYGRRLKVGGSTFINRGCMILDTPVADVVIGERCNIGPNCCIISVTHPASLDGRKSRMSIGQPITIGDDVWIGANVTILGGVTIGDGAVIGACSLVKEDIPPQTLAFGVPAKVVRSLRNIDPLTELEGPFAETLEDALGMENYLEGVGFKEGEMDVIELGLAMGCSQPLAPGVPHTSGVFHALTTTTAGSGIGGLMTSSGRRGSEQDQIQKRAEQRERVRKAEIWVAIGVGGILFAGLLLGFFFAGIYIAERRVCVSSGVMGDI